MLYEQIERQGLPSTWIWKIGIPGLLVLSTLVAGSIGTYQFLLANPQYSEYSHGERIVEAFLTSIAFFGLNTGPFPSSPGQTFPLIILSRVTGALFVSYAAVLWLGIVFAGNLRSLEISFRHRFSSVVAPSANPGHVVVCGLGTDGLSIARELDAAGRYVVGIEREDNVSATRRAREDGIPVITGDETDVHVLCQRAKAHVASEVYLTREDESENGMTVQTLAESVSTTAHPAVGHTTRCYANIETRRLRHHLHERVEDVAAFQLHSYDKSTATARQLLQETPVDRFSAESDTERVHIVLIGEKRLSSAILSLLCNTLHLESEISRSISIVCDDPERAEQRFLEQHPAVNPDNWKNQEVQDFVKGLFPEIEFIGLPSRYERLLSNSARLPDRFQEGDVLTVLIGDEDELEVGALVTAILPRLERYAERYDMDTTVRYYEAETNENSKHPNQPDRNTNVTVKPFSRYCSGRIAEAVHGDQRDYLAKRVALFYHMLYSYSSSSPSGELDSLIKERLGAFDSTFDAVVDNWETTDDDVISYLAELCWNDLIEHYRDANRYAADHIPLKSRIAERLSEIQPNAFPGSDRTSTGIDQDVVERIARIEHRRWCAEKLLNGWEPLPKEEWDNWDDNVRQEKLRRQQYHRDLWPLEALQATPESEIMKDIDQVRFVLNEFAHEENLR